MGFLRFREVFFPSTFFPLLSFHPVWMMDFVFCHYLFFRCCLEATTKSSSFFTQVPSKYSWRTVAAVFTICISWEHMKRLTQIHTADQQASWDQLHVSKSELVACVLNCSHYSVSTPRCDSSPSCSLLWMVTMHTTLWSHPVGPDAMDIFLIIPVLCPAFLQKHLHIKNHGNFWRSHRETRYSHASCIKHTYFDVDQFAVFSLCSPHYFSISFTHRCINDHCMSLERKQNVFLTIHF